MIAASSAGIATGPRGTGIALPAVRYARRRPAARSPRGQARRRLSETSGVVDDATLVKRFQSGSDPMEAIAALFDRYGAMTYAFFRRGIGDPQIAEELNQDLYVEVIKSLPRFRGRSSFKTWLFRLAYNHLSNLRRRWRTHLDEQPVEVPEDMLESLLPGDEDSPEHRLSREALYLQLRKCLARLPEVERAVILGRYYRNVTLDELTRQLELTNPSGARASLIAGQRKLKKCMEGSGEEPSEDEERRSS